MNAPKNATEAISRKILQNVAAGMTLCEALDAVLGEGTYDRLASDLYDALRS